MIVTGYKAFNKGLINRYGIPFEVGKIYKQSGQPVFGNSGNGFHFCKNLEDTLRYFPAMEEEVDIAEVTSIGKIAEFSDDYYGYYDMYVTTTIKINKVLTREEILRIFLNMPEERVVRFVAGYRLSKEEIEMFKMRYINSDKIISAIKYYQENDTEVYNKKFVKKKNN